MALKTANPQQIKAEAQSQARKRKTQEIAQKYEEKHAQEAKKAAPAATPNTTISKSSEEKTTASTIPSIYAVKKSLSPVVATASNLVKSVSSKTPSSGLTQVARSKTETKQDDKTSALAKTVKAAEKVKDLASKYAPSIVELTGAVNPNKNNNYGDFIRSAFDSKNVDKRNAEIPTLNDADALIDYYENLPKTNALQRLTSFEANNAYKERQALANQYQQAKDATIPSLLSKNNIRLNDLDKMAGLSNLGETLNMLGGSGGSAIESATFMGMKKYLMDNGLDETDAEYVANYLKRSRSNETNETLADIAGENTATKTLGTLYSFPARAVGSTGDVIDKLANYLTGEALTTDGSQASRIKNLSQDFRNVASQDLGKGGKFAYDIGTSIGDMALAMLLGKATGIGSTLSAGLMGSEKASDVMNEGVERELTPDQILAEGVASGLTTALTEKIPMGKLDDIAESGLSAVNAKEIGRVLAASALPEAGQEAAEDIADAIADALITGDKSQINDSIRMYEQNGLSHEEATVQAWIDFAKQVGMDALAGGISGGALGGGTAAISYLGNNANASFANPEQSAEPIQNNLPAVNNIDNATSISYDENKGEIANANTAEQQPGYDRTGSEGILRDVRRQGRLGETGLADGVSGGIYLPANRVSVADIVTKGEQVFDNNDKNHFAQNGIDYNEFYDTTDADTFVKALETAKVNNPDGAAVDSHSAENINEILANGGKVFLTADGTSGGAVENGNLTAVFKDSLNNKTPRMGGVVGLAGVKNGAYKGDCYGIFLVNSYSRSGFEPVARMKYAEGYNPEMDAQVKEQIASGKIKSAPDVYVLKLRDGHNYETCLNNYKTAKRYTQAELDALPLFDDYDKMMEYRDSLISNQSSNANSENTAIIPSVQETSQQDFAKAEIPALYNNNAISSRLNTETDPGSIIPTINNTVEQNNGGKTSRFPLRTLKDSDTFKMREESSKWLDEQTKSGLFNYNPIVNKETVETACDNLSKDFDGEVDRLQRTTDGFSATDVAESMVVLDLLTEQAEKSGDFSKVKQWAKSMQEKVTGIAQGLQMLSHFTRTASSTFMKVEKMAAIKAQNIHGKEDSAAKHYSKKLGDIDINRRASKQSSNTVEKLNKRLATIIDSIGNKPKKSNYTKPYSEIKTEVVNTLKEKLPEVYPQMSEKDIDLLTTFIADKTGGVNNDIIRDELEHFINNGMFYDLYENIPEKRLNNSQIATALKNMGYDGSMAIPTVEKSFDEVRNEVIGTLENEFASFPDMTDAQIDFLTTLAMDKSIPSWVITDELEHFENHGTFYTIDESIEQKIQKNSKLASALNSIGKDKSMQKNASPEKSFNTIRQEVINTLSDEMGSTFDSMTDNDIDFITTLVMDKSTSRDVLADEIEHYLKHGEFYTIDESIPVKKPTNRRLKSILDNYSKDMTSNREKAEKSYSAVKEEVINTLSEEYGSVFDNMSDEGIDFLTMLLMDKKVNRETIANELDHYAQTGTFYEIEEENHSTNKKLDNVLEQMLNDGTMVKEKPNLQKSFDEIREEVVNSLSDEMASFDFEDADIDYLARLIEGGASKETIYDALARKITTGHFEISDADIKAVIDLFKQRDSVGKNSKAANDFENQAYEIMAKYLGDATFKEKWNNYRYLAMLGNPRTHIRNLAGNLLFNITTNVKDNLAGILEELNDSKFTNQDRTRTFISWANPNDAALMRATQKDFYDNAYIPATDNSNKYTMDTDIKRHQKVFKEKGAGKLMNYLVGKNGEFLDKEDTFAIKNKYRRVLAGYLKANGKTADILTSKNKADIEFMDRARKFAVEQAKIATFHEDSAFADLLNATSRMARESDSAGAKALNVAIEAVFPFKKTPINIFKQGAIEYNPAVQVVNLIKNHKQYKSNPAEMIDSIAKGLSGTGIIALGALLASKGILRGSGKDEEDYAQGEQEYSINIGNRSFTIDWMAPTALPLFVGAEAYKWWQDNVATPTSEEDAKKFDVNKGIGGFMDALLSIGNPIMDLSMMQGLSNAFNSAASATNDESGGKLASFGTGLATGYLGQAVPTLAGQVARTMDPTRRSTYTGQPYGSVTDTAGKQLLKQWNKIPVLSMFNEPYINTSGEEEQNEDLGLGVAGRAIQNMLLPGYYSKTHENEVINELSELTDLATESVDGFKQSQIFPKAPDKKYNGEQLSRKDYTKAATIKGKTTTQNLEELFASDLYQNATPAEQVTLVHDLNNFSNQLYEHKMYGKVIDSSTYKGKYDAYMENGMQGYLDYIQGKAEEKQEKEENKEKNNALNNAGISTNSKLGKELKQSADINAAIEKATGVSEKERQATMEKLDNSSIDKAQITTSAKGGGTRVDWTKAVPYLTDMGLSPEERGEILYNTGKISDNEMSVMRDLGYSGVAQYYDNAYYGDTNYGDRDGNREKKEVISYLESLGSSPDEINMWLKYYNWKPDYKGN